MHTEAEDHDITSNDDGLAIITESATTPARGHIVGRRVVPIPGTDWSIKGHGRERRRGRAVRQGAEDGNAAQRK